MITRTTISVIPAQTLNGCVSFSRGKICHRIRVTKNATGPRYAIGVFNASAKDLIDLAHPSVAIDRKNTQNAK